MLDAVRKSVGLVVVAILLLVLAMIVFGWSAPASRMGCDGACAAATDRADKLDRESREGEW